ncbi:HflC protein [hydrothermal vent metagenome]|uniref:HflC protein n=1 Tax=hydrothermal vent metagenome TaxID=652676 RepID=A0A3B0TBF6_9ZZZZ
MQRPLFIGVIILVGALAAIAYASLFAVYQTQQALILRFGEAKRTITEPGLNWKIPIADTVIFLDNRILDLDSPAQEVIASDQKRLVVDAYARYKITNPLKFYQTMNNIAQANSRLANVLNSAVRRVLGDASFSAIVRDDRPALMKLITSQTNLAAGGFGIEIIDVRIRRADLPEANSQAVYRRMQTERQREASEARAKGQEASQRVRSRADRDVVVIEAEATREAETKRGQGDATRNQIFNEAFGKDPEFFVFYRSMQAYANGLKSDDTRLVISPKSEFFRYFNDPRGRETATQATGG